jgi:DNA-binding FadR family transcriptional regulator
MDFVGMRDSRVGDGTLRLLAVRISFRPLLWAFAGTDHEELVEIAEANALLQENIANLAAERCSKEEIARIEEAITQTRNVIAASTSILDSEMGIRLIVGTATDNESFETPCNSCAT